MGVIENCRVKILCPPTRKTLWPCLNFSVLCGTTVLVSSTGHVAATAGLGSTSWKGSTASASSGAQRVSTAERAGPSAFPWLSPLLSKSPTADAGFRLGGRGAPSSHLIRTSSVRIERQACSRSAAVGGPFASPGSLLQSGQAAYGHKRLFRFAPILALRAF